MFMLLIRAYKKGVLKCLCYSSGLIKMGIKMFKKGLMKMSFPSQHQQRLLI